jgi:hypothetical protein
LRDRRERRVSRGNGAPADARRLTDVGARFGWASAGRATEVDLRGILEQPKAAIRCGRISLIASPRSRDDAGPPLALFPSCLRKMGQATLTLSI